MNSKKYVLITGGNGFLAQNFSLKLIENYNLILWDLIFDKKFKKKIFDKSIKHKSSCLFQITNITKFNNVKKNILTLKDKAIYGLINCASINPQANSKNPDYFKNYNEFIKSWNLEIDIGLKGYMTCIYEISNIMKKFKKGCIINFSSDLGLISPNQNIYKKSSPKPLVYSVSKHGIIGMTKYFSTLLAPRGIRVNSLCFGGVMNNNLDKTFIEKINKLIPLNRMCNIEEIISPIEFLLDENNSYMTGQSLIIDGGRTIW